METTTMRTRLNAAIALFMALVLAIGLAPLPQAQALTAANLESQATDEAVTVALTIVDKSGADNVVYNGKVNDLTTDNTVADLLAAAGFHKIESADKYSGDSQEYYVEYNSPYFLGGGSGDSWWTTIFNGSSNDWSSAMYDSKLQANGHYQYIYNADAGSGEWESVFNYTSRIPDPLPAIDKWDTLLANLKTRFSSSGSSSALNRSSADAAMGLSLLDAGDAIDVEGVEANIRADSDLTAGGLAKYAIIMQSAGQTAKVTELIGRMESAMTKSESVYNAVWILEAYARAGVKPSSNAALSKADLINVVLKSQVASGLFGGAYAEAQITAQAIMALAPFKDENSTVANAIDKGVSALFALQNEDGGFSYQAKGESDLDTTGEATYALSCYGIDPSGPAAMSTSCNTPVSFLVKKADSDYSGYKSAGTLNELMTSSSAFVGLAAAEKARLETPWQQASIAEAKVAVASQTYTGSAIAPSATVTFKGKTLIANRDYTISYANNRAVGNAKATITGLLGYTGSVEAQFKIVPAGVSAASAAAITGATYSGSAVNPVPTLTFGGKALKSGTDFTVSYLNSSKAAVAASSVKAAGTYYARVAGKGNFTGTKDVQFSIAKAAISKTKVKKISKKKYTGKAIKPKPVVKFNGKKLKKGVDYKLSYSKNKKVGTAKVKIKGKGNFKGTKTVKFKIVKK